MQASVVYTRSDGLAKRPPGWGWAACLRAPEVLWLRLAVTIKPWKTLGAAAAPIVGSAPPRRRRRRRLQSCCLPTLHFPPCFADHRGRTLCRAQCVAQPHGASLHELQRAAARRPRRPCRFSQQQRRRRRRVSAAHRCQRASAVGRGSRRQRCRRVHSAWSGRLWAGGRR